MLISFPVPQQLRFRLEQLAALFDLPRPINNLRTMLAQKYDGDITIVPQMTMDDYMKYVKRVDACSPTSLMNAHRYFPS